MAKNKTTETLASVTDFVNAVKDPVKKSDSFQMIDIMQSISGFEPKMWGPAIIGFGFHHYVYESGREGDMPIIAFSPRSAGLSLYLYCSKECREKYLPELGKHKTDKGCITIKKLEDIKIPVLKKLIQESLKFRI